MKNLSVLEFYSTYFRNQNGEFPTIREIDKIFFKLVEKAQENGQQIIVSRGRPWSIDAYIYSLRQTYLQLREGKSIIIVTKDPDKYVKDLKTYCRIDVEYSQCMVGKKPSKGSYHLKLKK